MTFGWPTTFDDMMDARSSAGSGACLRARGPAGFFVRSVIAGLIIRTKAGITGLGTSSKERQMVPSPTFARGGGTEQYIWNGCERLFRLVPIVPFQTNLRGSDETWT